MKDLPWISIVVSIFMILAPYHAQSQQLDPEVAKVQEDGIRVSVMGSSPVTRSGQIRHQKLAGQMITYDVHQDYADEIVELMNTFMVAYSTADRIALNGCLSAQFHWDLHEGPESPKARTVNGVDGVLAVLAARRKTWSNVTYRDIRIHATPTLVTQTFRLSGIDETGTKFDLNAVDLYSVSDGTIDSKSSYWKQIQ
jgi:ketosteroid isomerase-like protein